MTKIKKEIWETTAKSIFGAIPYGGTALNELFFEYNGRIKQKRLNRFIKILEENFIQESGINIDNIKTEDFNDLFESVLRRVVQTKSELKLQRFKDILIHQLNEPNIQIEFNELYLDLISTLSEIELSILVNHKYFNLEYEEKIDKLNKLKDNLNIHIEKRKRGTIVIRNRDNEPQMNIRRQIKEIEVWLESLKKYRAAGFYNIDENKFLFFKQRLFSKGLLIDNPMSRIGTQPFFNMGITEFGIEFIEFIKGKNNNSKL